MNKLLQLLLSVFLLVSVGVQSRVWRVNVDYRMVGDLPTVESAHEIFINQDEFAEFEKTFAQKINKKTVQSCKLSVVKKLIAELNAFKKIAYDSTGHQEIKKTFKITRSDFVDDVVFEVYLQKKGKDLLVSRVIVSGHTQSSTAVVHCFESLLDESTFVDRWTKTGVLGLGVLGVVGYSRDWHQPYAQRIADRLFKDKPIISTLESSFGVEIHRKIKKKGLGILSLGCYLENYLDHIAPTLGGYGLNENIYMLTVPFLMNGETPHYVTRQRVLNDLASNAFWGKFKDAGGKLLFKNGQSFSFIIPLSILVDSWRLIGKVVGHSEQLKCAPFLNTQLYTTELNDQLSTLPIKLISDGTQRLRSTWQQIVTLLRRERVELGVIDDLPAEMENNITSQCWGGPAQSKKDIVTFFVSASSLSEFTDTRASWINLDGTPGAAIH